MTTSTDTTSTTTTDAPALSVVEFDAATQDRVASVAAHAATCGKLECGHTGRSTDPDVRRATFLYAASRTLPDAVAEVLATETPAVAAMFGEMVRAGVYAPRYVKRTTNGGRNTYEDGSPAHYLPSHLHNGLPVQITDERAEVWGRIILGQSLTQIAKATTTAKGTPRSVETVKSHAGWLRRRTGAHDNYSALIALVAAGRMNLRGERVTTDAEALARMFPVTEDTTETTDTLPEV